MGGAGSIEYLQDEDVNLTAKQIHNAANNKFDELDKVAFLKTMNLLKLQNG